jgi:hypothetical protein
MPFTQTSISDVRILRDGPEIYVAWDSTAPWGAIFQVYADRRLAWFGKARSCQIPAPTNAGSRNVWIEVGSVDASEANADFSSALSGPGGAGDRALLSWSGGSYLDPTGRDDVAGYRIYGSSAPGSPVDMTRVVDTVPAYPGGAVLDGFGVGGFGLGGFGRAASWYEWHSEPLGSGAWSFAVVPFDFAGNAQGAPQTVTLTISSAPRPPAPDSWGRRLNYSYAGPATRVATLSWLASP